jgi:hypothetical protein
MYFALKQLIKTASAPIAKIDATADDDDCLSH